VRHPRREHVEAFIIESPGALEAGHGEQPLPGLPGVLSVVPRGGDHRALPDGQGWSPRRCPI